MSEDNITTAPGNESHQLQGPRPGFDCTSFIEQVIEQTAKLANTMTTITSTFKNQQQKMKKVKDILSGISQVFVQGN